jgi:hypothetical protein
MPAYDSLDYDPPASVAHVTLRDIDRGVLLPNVSLLLDTGADVTLLPRVAVEQLGLKPLAEKEYELVGFDGTKSLAQAVELDMIFLNKAYRGRYLLTDDEHGVLGRDVLANIILRLNGPRQEWSELRNDQV